MKHDVSVSLHVSLLLSGWHFFPLLNQTKHILNPEITTLLFAILYHNLNFALVVTVVG